MFLQPRYSHEKDYNTLESKFPNSYDVFLVQTSFACFSCMVSCNEIAQINLHHSSGASSVPCKKLASNNFDLVALIHESWIHRGKILGLRVNRFNTLYDTTCARPRSCIIVSSRLKGLLLANYFDGDNIAMKINFEVQV